MNMIIATGGLDEMGIVVGYEVIAVIFAVVVGLATLSWWKYWLMPAVFAFVLILIGGVLIEPWKSIDSTIVAGSYPYDESYAHKMRIISIAWLVLFTLTTASLVEIIRYKKSKKCV